MSSSPACNISLVGDGPNVSVIVQTNAGSNGISLNFTNVSAYQPYRASIENIGLQTTCVAGTGIVISYGLPAITIQHNNITALISNVAIKSDEGTNVWANGVDITSAWNVHITDTFISGNTHYQVWENLSGTGIRMRQFCVNSHFSNVQVSYFNKGFHWDRIGSEWTEGLFFSNCSFAQLNYGVDIVTTGTRVSTFTWQGGLIELRKGASGFRLAGCDDVHIKNTMIIEGVPVPGTSGIDLDGVNGATIIGVEFYAIETGVNVFGLSSGVNIKNCYFRGGNKQVAFAAGTTGCRSGGHTYYNVGTNTPLFETNGDASNRIYEGAGLICYLNKDNTQTVANNSENAVIWDVYTSRSFPADPIGMFLPADPTKIFIPAGVTHVKATLGIRWKIGTTGGRQVKIKDSDTVNWASVDHTSSGIASGGGDCTITTGIIPVFGKGYVQASVLQSSGSAIEVRDVQGTFFSVEVVG